MRLAVLASHPVQYYAPLFRELARHVALEVFYAHAATEEQQAQAGFGTKFTWDLDLTSGYPNSFLANVAANPSASHFFGCDTPEIESRLKASGFTHVLCLGWHLKSMWQGIWAAKRLGLSVMVRGDSQLGTQRSLAKQTLKAAAYPFMLRVFDAALYVGSKNRAYYQRYGLPSKRLFHSPHCVDTERFSKAATLEARSRIRQRFGLSDSDTVLLFAGKLLPFKRPLDVIEAAAHLRANGLMVHVLIAGSGPLEADMRMRAPRAGVPLHILGFQNQSEMPGAYAAADVLALPSDARETWGLVCNEALASGRPVVVSDAIGSAPDIAADNNVGRTHALGNVEQLATAIGQTVGSYPSPQQIRSVSDRFGLRRAVDGILEAIGGDNFERRFPLAAPQKLPHETCEAE